MKQYSGPSKRTISIFWLGILILVLVNCGNNKPIYDEFSFNGATMGTTYHISIVGDPIDVQERSQISSRIDSFLINYNHTLSTYDDQSEISYFNRNLTTEPINVSAELLHVVGTGIEFCEKSGGAFDITVMPIVNFFGFGFEPGEDRFPNVEEIDAWLQLTGCDKLELGDTTITKSDPRISIDLSAIAKGDACDHVTEFIREMGFQNVFVEVGGEIMTHGVNQYGKHWKVGIDRPTIGGAPGADLQHIIQLTNMAVASSGDYRNYREVEGQRISHAMDPRTGSPIDHNLAAVTVITNTCLMADGLSTSVMVLGLEEGLSWLEDFPDAEGLLITRENDGSFKEFMTTGFNQYLAD